MQYARAKMQADLAMNRWQEVLTKRRSLTGAWIRHFTRRKAAVDRVAPGWPYR